MSKFLKFSAFALFLPAGMCHSPGDGHRHAEVSAIPTICEGSEPRRWSDAEWKWRKENAPGNLRKDFEENRTGREFCGWDVP